MSQSYALPGQLWLLPQSQQEGLDLDRRQVIAVVEKAYRALRKGGSNNPVKTIIDDPGHHSLSYSMVARTPAAAPSASRRSTSSTRAAAGTITGSTRSSSSSTTPPAHPSH